jgi:hypothetical protein
LGNQSNSVLPNLSNSIHNNASIALQQSTATYNQALEENKRLKKEMDMLLNGSN